MPELIRHATRGWWHWCPACDTAHLLPETWEFDGNTVAPTFRPSFAQTFVHWTSGIGPDGLGRGERQVRTCHYNVTAGELHFHFDSWHRRSDVVAMPPIPADLIT